MSEPMQTTVPQGILSQIEGLLDEYMVKKAPFAIPMNAKETIVKIAPYLVIVFAVITIPAVLALFGFASLFGAVAMMGGYATF